MGVNFAELVSDHARLSPASPAIISQDQIITYRQLNVAVAVVARHLLLRGVQPRQVAGVSLGQNALHVITLLALARIGAVSLPLHMAVPAQRRALAAARFGASWVISGRDDMALAGIPFISLAGLRFDGSSLESEPEIHDVEADAPFRIAISSGTSGDPKGMILTHRLMTLRSNRPQPYFSNLSRTLPMDLSFGLGFWPAFSALARGSTVVLARSMDPEHLLQAIVRHAVTHVMLSPAQAHAIVDLLAAGGPRCPGLVCLRIAGGPLNRVLLDELLEKLTPNVYVMYGSTECNFLTHATPEILSRQPASVGRVCPWATIEVVGQDGIPLPPGSTGELRIRSELRVSGYHLDEVRTRQHFRDGWFYPGDLGRFDAEGLLYIEGRADDRLNVGGLKVNPEDIDAVLAGHVGVAEAGAFVLTGEEGQEMLAVAVVLREGADIDKVRDHARTQLGPLAPTRYFRVSSLPRTITGKLRRADLSDLFLRNVDGQ